MKTQTVSRRYGKGICLLAVRLEQYNISYTDILCKVLTKNETALVQKYVRDKALYPEAGDLEDVIEQ